MVLLVPLVGLSAMGIVFVWFSYGFVRFAYGCNRPPLVGLSALGIVFLWFSYGFRTVVIVSLFGSSAFRVVFLGFSYGVVRCSHGSNRPPHWSIRVRGRFRMVFLWFCKVFVWF